MLAKILQKIQEAIQNQLKWGSSLEDIKFWQEEQEYWEKKEKDELKKK